MAQVKNDPYFIYNELRDFGFVAGITLKGPWKSQSDVYRFVRRELAPIEGKVVIPRQVHGSNIRYIDSHNLARKYEADGVLTRSENLCLTVSTADCIPLLVADSTSGIFGAVHIGWRGFVSGIVENLVFQTSELGMKIDSSRFIIGPSIGPCCLEVGPEVASLFEDTLVSRRGESTYVDLRGAVRNKLVLNGVDNNSIGGASECTSCDPSKYYSYRRDKRSPVQMVTFIYKSI
jgi:YfiH family protein